MHYRWTGVLRSATASRLRGARGPSQTIHRLGPLAVHSPLVGHAQEFGTGEPVVGLPGEASDTYGLAGLEHYIDALTSELPARIRHIEDQHEGVRRCVYKGADGAGSGVVDPHVLQDGCSAGGTCVRHDVCTASARPFCQPFGPDCHSGECQSRRLRRIAQKGAIWEPVTACIEPGRGGLSAVPSKG